MSERINKINAAKTQLKIFFQILVPTYNAVETIENALNSVVNQTFNDWICIVLDDCSTDKTYEVLEQYVKKFPEKFRVGRLEKRIPTGEVRNLLIAEALKFNSPYTLWLDSDDTFGGNEVFQRIYDRLKETAYPDLLQLSYNITFENGTSEFRQAKCTSVQALSEDGRWQACWTKCVKTKLLAKFDPGLFRFEDTSQHFETLEKVRTVNFYNDGSEFPVVRYQINRTEQTITPEALDRIRKLSKTVKLDCLKRALQKTVEYWKELCRIDNTIPGEPSSITGDVDVIVSLTTYGERLKSGVFRNSIKSILDQKTKLRVKICLTLFDKDVNLLSKDSLRFLELNGVEIIKAPLNLRPHLKYFYVMLKYPNVPVITVDDDCFYDELLVQTLYSEHLQFPKTVVAARVHKITYRSDGTAKPYREWLFEYNSNSRDWRDVFATGVGGVLYPANVLKLQEDDINEIVEKALTNDDIWLKKRENELDVAVRWVPVGKTDRSYTLIKGSQNSALCINENVDENDIIVKKLAFERQNDIATYPIIYITDANYVEPLIHSIVSLARNGNKTKKYSVNVLCDSSVTDVQKKRISLTTCRNVQTKIKNIDLKLRQTLDKITQVNKVAKCATYKFYLADIFDDLDFALYVDCDTLFLNDPSECFDVNLIGKYCAVVRDYKVCNANIYKATFHSDIVKKNNGYFNSGVMVMNFDLMRRHKVSNKLLDYRTRERNTFMDQDALNVVFGGRVLWLNCNWNFIASNLLFDKRDVSRFYSVSSPGTVDEVLQSKYIKILHITGVEKPWSDIKSKWFKYWSNFNVK